MKRGWTLQTADKIYLWSHEITEVYLWYNKIRPESQYHPFTPWPNTLCYFPFRQDFVDVTWNQTLTVNNVGLTDWWQLSIPCAEFYGSSSLTSTSTIPLTWASAFTFSCWMNPLNTYSWWIFTMWTPPSEIDPYWQAVVGGDRTASLYFNMSTLFIWSWWNDAQTNIDVTDWIDDFHNVIMTQNNNSVKVYIDGVQVFSQSWFDYDLQSTTTLIIWNDQVDWARYFWFMNEVILENKEWTSLEVLNYFNSTCTEYWHLPINS